ncbi:MAG: acetylornithine deacetylase [Thermoanaerobaculia bacterium]|nr:acetylornithine deacetylase [Thermoanaerobaculia bacterium]
MTSPAVVLSDLELLARLVSYDSTSHHSNLPIADAICDYLDRPGIRIQRNPNADGDKTNLIVQVGPEIPTDRSGLSLSGHMDVVPATEPEWTSDPFELVDRGEHVVARGACDMKGFVALAVNAAVRWSQRRDDLRAPLALLLTFDEEVGTLGAHHFVDTWPLDRHPLPRRAVIGEPTSLRAVRLHKGHARGQLILRGTPAHSGYPHLGHSAIEPMGRAIVALSRLGEDLRAERHDASKYFPEVPFVALNLARIDGGAAINIVPDLCRLDVGFRVLPGIETDAIHARLRETVAEVLDGEDWAYQPGDESPPMNLPEDHDLHRAVCALHGQTETVSASYATDAGWFQTGGFDCVLYGPGDIGVAHKPNESLPKTELEQCSHDLDRLIETFCVEEADTKGRPAS